MRKHLAPNQLIVATLVLVLLAGVAVAQTPAPSAAAPQPGVTPSGVTSAAAPQATPAVPEIVDLACTVAKGGICRPGEDCKPADRLGEETLPLKITIDFDNRIVMSPVSRGYVSSSRIAQLAHDQDQFMLQGIEHGFAWLMSIQETTRALSLTVTSVRGVFVGFGSCVPIESLQGKKN